MITKIFRYLSKIATIGYGVCSTYYARVYVQLERMWFEQNVIPHFDVTKREWNELWIVYYFVHQYVL